MKRKTESIIEFVDARGAKIDAAAGVVRGVKVLGAESKNGRHYPESTLTAAVALYEGRPCFLNHVDKTSQRRYQDRFGAIGNVRVDGGSLFADLTYNPRHPVAEQFAWDVEHNPTACGLSHTCEAKVSRDKAGKVVVEQILAVESVDLVALPATSSGLFEGLNPERDEEMTLKEITLEALTAERADLVEAIIKSTFDNEDAKKATAELTALREEVKRYKEAEALTAKKAAIDKMIAEAKLPAELNTEVFRASLLDAKDAKALIEDRKLSAPAGAKAKSREQTAGGGATMTTKEFVEAITD